MNSNLTSASNWQFDSQTEKHSRSGNSRRTCGQEVNVGEAERWASMVGGGLLATCGLLRGSMSGLALAALGGALAYRGYTGHCDAYEALDYSTADEQQKDLHRRLPA